MTVHRFDGRLKAVEYATSSWSVSDVARLMETSEDALVARMISAEGRVQTILQSRKPRIAFQEDRIRPEAFAGLIRLDGGLELEVAPKFIGDADSWREDFFCIATLSHFGRMLPAEAMPATRGPRGDLATLAGRALVELYWQNRRRPLRTYRSHTITEYSADGEIDAEALLFPSEDGYATTRYSLTRQNDYNATLQRAAELLLPEVTDGDTSKQLERVVHQLGHQLPGRHVGRHRVLPGRARRWQPAHDLACDVLAGFGVRFGEANTRAPGFLVDTWRAWQDLVTLAIRIGLPNAKPVAQAPFRLGERVFGTARRSVNAIPDIVLGIPKMVVIDAKYKGRSDEGHQGISESDLYEALAFLEATVSEVAVLAYPAIPHAADTAATERPAPGTCKEIERVTIGARTIIAIGLEVRGISGHHGLQHFSSNVASWFRAQSLA